MKQHLENMLQIAVKHLQEVDDLPAIPAFIQVEPTRDKSHGDFASNIALVLAKPAKRNPKEIAELIINAIPESPYIEKVVSAGPGFINIYLTPHAFNDVVAKILAEQDEFGRTKMGRGKRVIVEFVSANPTGPLHVGHGRHAAFGAIVSNLLGAVGFKPFREYYVNDAGRQMDILTVSIWLRYIALFGEKIKFPANGYQGDYIIDIAQSIYKKEESFFQIGIREIFTDLPKDEPEGGDKEQYIDALINRAKLLLGEKYTIIFKLGLDSILGDIREDLREFGVEFDNWFSERKFVASDVVDKLIARLKESNYAYEKDGALWFRSTEFGDEKDRVLQRQNGSRTYFANDIAYHLNKFERGFDIAIDLFGADHHGYVPRMKAAMESAGINPERLMYLLVQFVSLYRNGEQVQMSTRGGSFVTLRELRAEVGNDAARYFYVMRKCEQPVDFDLDLAKSQSNDNPVYYVQYAHARICSVFKQLAERNLKYNEAEGLANLSRLDQPQERELLNTLSRYPDIIIEAALHYEPHQLTNYLRDLAADFHAYYNSHQFIVDDAELRNARLALIASVRQTLKNAFAILGISAPETM